MSSPGPAECDERSGRRARDTYGQAVQDSWALFRAAERQCTNLFRIAQDDARRSAIADAAGNLERQTNQFVIAVGNFRKIQAFNNDNVLRQQRQMRPVMT